MKTLTGTIALLLLAGSTSLRAAPDEGHLQLRIKSGKVVAVNGEPLPHVKIGFSPLELTPELRDFFSVPADRGLLVQALEAGGPAAGAGLRVGDIVTAVDGTPLKYAWSLSDVLLTHEGGDLVKVDLIRDRQPRTLTIMLADRPLPSQDLGMSTPATHVLDTDGELRQKLALLQQRLREVEAELLQLKGGK